MERKNNIVIGILFVALGALFALKNLGIVDFNFFDIGFLFAKFWPSMFLLIPALAFHSIYFSGKSQDAGVLVPGGLFLGIGVTCQVSMLFGIWEIMWPGFIMAVALGLFELYLFGGRQKALLIPVGILGGLSLAFFSKNLLQFEVRHFFVSIALIIIGLLIIFKKDHKKGEF